MEQPKRLITKILETAFMLALSVYLIRAAAYWLLEIWPILLAVAIVVMVIIIIYRIRKHKHDLGRW